MDHQVALIAGAGLAIMITASVFSRRTGVAAPLLLVGLGIAASYLPGAPTLHVDPELILAGVLPPLLYSSAVNLPVIDVRRNLALISWLSIAMVIVSALGVGLIVHALFEEISLPLAIALGAVVSPTDAVAATAIGRRVGLPPRLMAVLEGESLVNDASALVVLRTAVAGLAATGQFSLFDTTIDFIWAVLGAAIVGAVAAQLTTLLRQRLDDPVLNTTISFAVPFCAFFPAEELGASGVLAVVVAGLLTGTQASRRFSARDRQTRAITWSTFNFILESAVFIVMGYQLPALVGAAHDETTVGEMAALVTVVFAALVVFRFASLAWPALRRRRQSGRTTTSQTSARLDQFESRLDEFTLAGDSAESRMEWARRRLARGRADLEFERREPITLRGLTVIAWAGMRGVVTVAAVQTIPAGTPHRNTVVLAAFLIALITLVVFGLTLPGLIRRMEFRVVDPAEQRDAVHTLMRQVGESALATLGPLEEQTIDGRPLSAATQALLKDQLLPRLLAGLGEARQAPSDVVSQSAAVQRVYVAAMREALDVERGIGAYRSETYRQVEALLDVVEQRVGRS